MELERFRDAWREQPLEGLATQAMEDVMTSVKRRADRFERQIHLRDLAETAAGLLVMAWAGYIGVTTSWMLARVGAAVVIFGCLQVMIRLWLARRRYPIEAGASTRAFCDNQVRRLDEQIHLLRTVGWWYLAPLLGGALLMVVGLPGLLTGKIGTATAIVAVGAGIYVINRRALQTTLLPMRDELARLAREFAVGPHDDGRPDLTSAS